MLSAWPLREQDWELREQIGRRHGEMRAKIGMVSMIG